MGVSDDPVSAPSARNEQEITLQLLAAVERNAEITQRSISQELGIALGLANAYLKRCARKGLIKIAQAPANRYAYYLTPSGFAEKSRLTGEFLRQSFFLVRAARAEYGEIFTNCQRHGWSRIVLCGAGEVGEIATLAAAAAGLPLLGFVDANTPEATCAGLPVAAALAAFGEVDAAVVTDLADPQGTFDAMARLLPVERVLAPPFFHVSRQLPPLAE